MNWTQGELNIFRKLRTPAAIQAYIDRLPYRVEDDYCSPRTVMRQGRAHCFDGALFAAAALRQLGMDPILMDLRAQNDDDHVLAVYRYQKTYGAIAKSNFTGLRFREPVYSGLRELAMSFFHDYFNTKREKTLRQYSSLVHLKRFDRLHWMFDDSRLGHIAAALDKARHFKIISAGQVRRLAPVDSKSFCAGTLYTNLKGAYRVN